MFSIIIPTYNERENIIALVPRLSAVLQANQIDGEIIVVDDASPDGTAAAVAALAQNYPVHCLQRKGRYGIGTAILAGFREARGDIVATIDADDSHPLAQLPVLYQAVHEGELAVAIGSRCVSGGADKRPWTRRFLSGAAHLAARGLTTVKDTTSGFFCLRKDLLSNVSFTVASPQILLELLVKKNIPAIKEFPIIFQSRTSGKSKININVLSSYGRHWLQLYLYKFENWLMR